MALGHSLRLIMAPPHPAGRPFIIGGVVVAVLGGLLLGAWAFWLGTAFASFCLYFFRDPARVAPGRPGLVLAPADGKVALAAQGMHFEGGLILIDHGQGLISQYLHLSRVDVREGETVRRGQRIGAVGAEGRATGPHLCWRLKWQGRNLDPMLLVGARAP